MALPTNLDSTAEGEIVALCAALVDLRHRIERAGRKTGDFAVEVRCSQEAAALGRRQHNWFDDDRMARRAQPLESRDALSGSAVIRSEFLFRFEGP